MGMVGLVVVSHSPALARAAVDLAAEMVAGETPPVAIAAGTGEGQTGTDATRIASAIGEVASPDGVLVIMDLGSAILSAELALELRDDDSTPVRLSSAPFFEGLQSAVVRAAGGASLAEVEREAAASLGAKRSQLGAGDDDRPVEGPDVAPAQAPAPDVTADLVLVNPDGLHARPAAAVVAAVAGFDADVTMLNVSSGIGPVSARSPIGLATLAARSADTVRVAASGPDAEAAVDALRALVEDGFGERPASSAPPKPASPDRDCKPLSRPVGVSPGRVVGPAVVVNAALREPDAAAALDEDERAAAAERAEEAASAVADQLGEMASDAAGSVQGVLRAIQAIAQDPELAAAIRATIVDEGRPPDRAVWEAFAQVAAAYAGGGQRLAARVIDLHAVRDRLIATLTGQPTPGVPATNTPYVLVAADLAPTDAAVLDPALCRAIVTEQGGPTSHTAILARTLGIPAVVAAAGISSVENGTILLVDGTTGEVVIDPSPEQREGVTGSARSPTASGPGSTADGHRVPLLANIASADDLSSAGGANAEGVGLFRTEFLFLGRQDAPAVDEQIAAYRAVFARSPGQKVVIRTLDAGADKPLPFVAAHDEPNPALGVRGYRTAARHPELLEDQLAAIAAAAGGTAAEAWVMAPMITTPQEAAEFAEFARRHSLGHVGVMIETPAAALLAAEVLSAVDFVSLGTNDLTQYTMAADRTLGDLAWLNDPWQPSVLRLIRTVCAAGAAAGKPVGVCGEAAADPVLATVLTGLGATTLSMTPRARSAVATRLAGVTLTQCRAAAETACAAGTPVDARSAALGATGR